MRKVGALFLATFFLFLTACSGQTTAVTPTAMPAVSPPLQTASVSTAGSINVFLPNGPLPKTEYEPISQPARYYEGVTNKLIPSNDYGHICPYLGGFLYTDMARSSFYGLCDEKGRIICDPVYHKVDIIEKDGVKLYKFTKYVTKGNIRNNEIAKITLARPDGSWADEYDNIYTVSGSTEFPPVKTNDEYYKWLEWRPQITNEYITVCKGGKWGAIDYYGNEILPCAYNAPLFFSDGLAAVFSDDLKAVRYINNKGNNVLGPYQAPPKQDNSFQDFSTPLPITYGLEFSEGLARFYKDGKFGVIDKSGNIIVTAKYDYISSYYDNTASFLYDGKYGVLGSNGDILLEPTAKKILNGGKGVVIISDNYSNGVSINLFTGERKPWSYNQTEKYTYSKGGVTLTLRNGEQRFFETSSISELKNGNYILYSNDKKQTWKIINPDGETVAGPFEGRPNDTSYYSRTYSLILVNLGESGQGTWSYSWLTVYDETGKRLLPGYYLDILPFDGRYLVRDDTASGLLNESGYWALKVPIFDYAKD